LSRRSQEFPPNFWTAGESDFARCRLPSATIAHGTCRYGDFSK
jgi:hypothetical protein